MLPSVVPPSANGSRARTVPPLALMLLAVLVGLAGLLGVVGPAVPAQAHDVLVSSDPADGAVVDAAPAQVSLAFSAEQVPVGAATSVTGPDGQEWADGDPVVDGSTVTQPLRAGMPPGDYTVAWRSVAADGHPITGVLTFAVTGQARTGEPTEAAAGAGDEPTGAAGPAEPGAEATDDVTAGPDAGEPADEPPTTGGPDGAGQDVADVADDGSTGTSARLVVLVAALVAAVLVVAATVAAMRRRRSAP